MDFLYEDNPGRQSSSVLPADRLQQPDAESALLRQANRHLHNSADLPQRWPPSGATALELIGRMRI